MSIQVFTPEEIDGMCRRCGFTREQLHEILLKVGPSALPVSQRKLWSPENPVNQFCYRLTETIHRSGRTPHGFVVMRKGDAGGSHYFFQNPDTGEIIDPTADQFTPVGSPRGGFDYGGAKRKGFLPQISNGARSVATAFGWELRAVK